MRDLRDHLADAKTAVAFAQQVRSHHRRRSERVSEQRQEDIELALTRLREAMQPLRSHIGRIPYTTTTAAGVLNRERVLKASAALQRERRKLFKMQNRPRDPLQPV